MSSELLPDNWTLLRVGETINARLTPEQLDRAIHEAKVRYGITFAVEPQQHYWLTVVSRHPKE